jgi:hypothetical protein
MSNLDPDHLIAHTVSAGAIVGTITGHLPTIAAVIGMIWYGLQVWETKTVQASRPAKSLKHLWSRLTRLQP